MKKTVIMRPQDIVVLVKIFSLQGMPWRATDLAHQLFMSQSEVSNSLSRSRFAGLIDDTKKKVHVSSLLEFLAYGIRYVFPEKPGEIVRGIPTAHSAMPLVSHIKSAGEAYVWQDEDGLLRGQKIAPLYPSVVKAVKLDAGFYEMMSLVDAIRVGKVRERQLAIELLGKRLLIK